jgi:hypothetical protein
MRSSRSRLLVIEGRLLIDEGREIWIVDRPEVVIYEEDPLWDVEILIREEEIQSGDKSDSLD